MKNNTSLDTILEQLHRERGVDFSQFKQGTLQRRVEKRLIKCKLTTFDEYLGLLEQNPAEYDALFNELTINVTDFFRDDQAFNALKSALEIDIRNDRLAESGSYRVWSAACATGEEPYSVAILLAELLGPERFKRLDVKIYATDIDQHALQLARGGLYSTQKISKLHPDWVDRYFQREGKMLRIIPQLRDVIEFSEHNLFTPPPVDNLDLLLCRNVLIYFSRESQEQVLFGFHQALKPRGLFLMGRSEIPMDRAHDKFHCINFPGRLYRRK